LAQPLFTTRSYVKYRLKAISAHGIHSPFVFKLFNECILPSASFRLPEIETLREALKNNEDVIELAEFKNNTKKNIPISEIARSTLSRPQFSAFLSLLARLMEVRSFLETGTSLGLNTLYLAKDDPKRKVTTLEGNQSVLSIAKSNAADLGIKNIEFIQGNIYDTFLPSMASHRPEMVFLDADHRASTLDHYMNVMSHFLDKIKVIIIHDIYWSKEMNEKWKELILSSNFNCSVDIFDAGLLFPNIDMEKQHFTLKFRGLV
jgi:predicted O-methyltransferase YrrM